MDRGGRSAGVVAVVAGPVATPTAVRADAASQDAVGRGSARRGAGARRCRSTTTSLLHPRTDLRRLWGDSDLSRGYFQISRRPAAPPVSRVMRELVTAADPCQHSRGCWLGYAPWFVTGEVLAPPGYAGDAHTRHNWRTRSRGDAPQPNPWVPIRPNRIPGESDGLLRDMARTTLPRRSEARAASPQ
jgi:hypothetical protein